MKHLILFSVLLLLSTVSLAAGQGGSAAIHPIYYLLGFGAVGLVANASTIVALQRNYSALFNETFDTIQTNWQRVATEVPSTSHGNTYSFILDTPRMREWLGDKIINKLKGADYYIKNKPWEASFGVDEDDVEDDNLGMYPIKVKELADEGKRHPDELVSIARQDGETTKCWDGYNFYATDHKIDKSGTQSNLLAGTGTTLAKISDDLKKVRAQFRKFKTSQGKPFIRRTGKLDILVTCPVELEAVFEELKNSKQIGGSDNPLLNAFDYIVDPYLEDNDAWYADYVGGFIKAFLLQMRKRPELKTRQRDFDDKIVKFGIEARYNVGYALWPFSIKVKQAA
ncbi:MAG: Mu-like prophage major head subunit gpT family protein [Bacteroidota bacterium]